MKIFKNKIGLSGYSKELTHYPELFYKKPYSTDIHYSIARANSVILDDTPPSLHALNWKLI